MQATESINSLLTWEQAVQWLRDQPDQQEFVKQCYYDDPVLEAAERFCESEEWSAIRELLGAHLPGKVLELGAGRGIVSFAFASLGCEVTALEPDASALVGRGAIEELSRSSGYPMRILSATGEQIPVEDASFDVVFGRCVLHHARDLSQVCREVARVLRPGGFFLAEREHVLEKREDLSVFLESHPLHNRYGGENAYLLGEYKSAFRRAGLRIRKSIPPYHHAINFVPPMSIEKRDVMTRQALAKILPNGLASTLATLPWMKSLYSRSLSWRCHQPGKFYSFMAQRPV